MSNYQENSIFLQESGAFTKQSFVQKGLCVSNVKSQYDLMRLLELLNITNDCNLQFKLFSSLSAYLMFNKGANIDVIINCNAVYDKLQRLLSKASPSKSADALNFLSALLYVDAEEDGMTRKKTLAVYARNMTRVSGCLSAMCEMFTDYMLINTHKITIGFHLYHDTWKALCQCLAVACSGNEINQSYCSHLIPVCIQKCSQANIDTLLVLQSLMIDHQRNSQLFLNCNGVKIFTRDLLHYDKCMQLLTTVVQCPGASSSLHQTNVFEDLRDFLRLYGPNSQLGQRAIIILNHLSIRARETEPTRPAEILDVTMNSNQTFKATDVEKQSLSELTVNNKTDSELEETKVLMQNVMKEVFKWKQSESKQHNNDAVKPIRVAMNRSRITSLTNARKLNTKNKTSNKTNTLRENTIDKIRTLTEKRLENDDQQRNLANELSFSFLDIDEFKVPNRNVSLKKTDSLQISSNNTQYNGTTVQKLIDTNKHKQSTVTLQDFSPIFASTPKQRIESRDFTKASVVNSLKPNDLQEKTNKYNNLKMKRQNLKKPKRNNMKNRSLGARFFSAINDSCTTFVKTVKNIFNKKESLVSSQTETSSSSNTVELSVAKHKRSKTYSFINYMRKRDAVLNNGLGKNKLFDSSNVGSLTGNSCKTCNDTAVLKQKLSKDEFLKQTVKKLKLGINLYGCDFKKISKTMWPREKYMTPLVLYNLYRKLLLK